MAIKGKGKTRSRRAVSPAPRPQMVTRRSRSCCGRPPGSWWGVSSSWPRSGSASGPGRAPSGFRPAGPPASRALGRHPAGPRQLPADQTTPQGTSQINLFPTPAPDARPDRQGAVLRQEGRRTGPGRHRPGRQGREGRSSGSPGARSSRKSFNVGVTPALTAPGMTSSALNETAGPVDASRSSCTQSAGDADAAGHRSAEGTRSGPPSSRRPKRVCRGRGRSPPDRGLQHAGPDRVASSA